MTGNERTDTEKTVNRNVPVFILAGGYGTRLSEETNLRPKPMLEIGGIPIVIHIMRSYYLYGFNDFVICAGYKASEIKKYFIEYSYHVNDIEIDFRDGKYGDCRPIGIPYEPERWRIRVLDTGLDTMTGGRVAKALRQCLRTDSFSDFALTYGDGLCNANLDEELRFHRSHGRVGTVLGVRNIARFGELDVREDGRVAGFLEKPEEKQGFINGGFFFFRSSFMDYLSGSSGQILEREPLEKLASDDELHVYQHTGFWHAMDTLRDKLQLQATWDSGNAPWTVRSEYNVSFNSHYGRDGVSGIRTHAPGSQQ